MQYLALLYSNEKDDAARGEAWNKAHFEEYFVFGDWLKQNEVKHSGEALEPVSTATTVRVRDGKTTMTDGPFAETKEQLGGFYLFDAKDLDEAVKIAARIPAAKIGSVEVRPVMRIG